MFEYDPEFVSDYYEDSYDPRKDDPRLYEDERLSDLLSNTTYNRLLTETAKVNAGNWYIKRLTELTAFIVKHPNTEERYIAEAVIEVLEKQIEKGA